MASMNPLAAALGGASSPLPPDIGPAAGASADVGDAAPGADLAAMLGGGGPDQGAPPFTPQGSGPMYPTTDPKFMGDMLGQILSAQQADHMHLATDQQHALTDNPIFQALAAGAPLGPGAGQDGQAIQQDPGVLPGA